MLRTYVTIGALVSAVCCVVLVKPASRLSTHNGVPHSRKSGCSAEVLIDYNLKLSDASGKTVRLADYRGKVILLNFWATWCGPCMTELPLLTELEAAYREQGFAALGVVIFDTAEAVRGNVTAFDGTRVNYPLVMTHVGLERAYGPIASIPTSVFIGRDGSSCGRYVGALKKDTAVALIKTLL